MSPGASWDSFEISDQEYSQVLSTILHPNLEKLRQNARFAWNPMRIDSDFDEIQERFEWMQAVCNKHRDRLEGAGAIAIAPPVFLFEG